MPGEFQLGDFGLRNRPDPAQQAAPPEVERLPGHTRAQRRSDRVQLPDWMREPPPPRRTLGQFVHDATLGLPGGRALQRRWWAWQERSRLYERYPTTFKIAAFFISWALATALVLAAYGIFVMA